MSEFDVRLSALFAEDLPPLSDPAFTAGVTLAMARWRLFQDLTTLALLALGSAVALWGAWPWLGKTITDLASALAPAGGALLLALLISAAASSRGGFDPRLQT